MDGIECIVVLKCRGCGTIFGETDKTNLPGINIEVMAHLEVRVALDRTNIKSYLICFSSFISQTRRSCGPNREPRFLIDPSGVEGVTARELERMPREKVREEVIREEGEEYIGRKEERDATAFPFSCPSAPST